MIGKFNVVSVWVENFVGLVSKLRIGIVVIDKIVLMVGIVSCLVFI